MTKEQQKFFAFLIPLVLSITLLLLTGLFFEPSMTVSENGEMQGCMDCYNVLLEIYLFVILCIFLLSFILPFFVKSKQKPINRSEFNLTK
jgi:hypothetical protein